jgi:hypothetical protein
MAFPTTSVLENFTGTDGTTPPNSNWTNKILDFTALSGIKIDVNQAAKNTTAYGNDAYYNVSTYGPDSEAYVTVPNIPAVNAEQIVLFARLNSIGSGTTTGYALIVGHDGTAFRLWRLYKIAAGGFNLQIGSNTLQSVAAGDGVGLEIIGSTLTGYWKSGAGAYASVLSGTDSTYTTAGNIGFQEAATSSLGVIRLDNFGGGTYAGGTAKTGIGIIGP